MTAQASAILTIQALMQHQIDEGSTLRQQLRQECTAREEAEQAAHVKADECAVMVNEMEAHLSVAKTSVETINEHWGSKPQGNRQRRLRLRWRKLLRQL